MFAPTIDNIIEGLKSNSGLINPEIYNKLLAINKAMSIISPAGDDEVRRLWLEVPRGTIKDFGKFQEYKEEEIVETYEEFESLWKEYYPDETKWYGFTTAKYQDQVYFYFDSKLIFTVTKTEEPNKDNISGSKNIYRFLDWLRSCIKKETEKLMQDVDGYNMYLEKNLSYHKRTGRIKRHEFWSIFGDDAIRPDKNLGAERINKLREIVDEQKNNGRTAIIPRMTADDFFRYCEICYDANNYFGDTSEELSPREKYLRMADGRDAGLRSIEGNSQNAFLDWYHGGGRSGGHPWEICRGGNSTHISLFATSTGDDWRLRLAGSSIVRIEETVKMAVALFNKNIPFILDQAEEIFDMVTGKDYIGIVPDECFPRYCHSLFPSEDRIIDFMNLGNEKEKEIIEKAYWYPLERIRLRLP